MATNTALPLIGLAILISGTGCHASCDARSLIAQHEGKRDCVYKDTMGHPTIGIGYNLDNPGARQAISAVGADYDSIRSGKTCLTDSQVMKLFEPSYQSAVAGARRAVSSYDSLCCEVQNVMTDMDYNLGDGGFASFGGFIGYINKGEWSQAAADGRGTAWCGQVGNRCTDDMSAVARGCGGPSPSPPSPPSPPSENCKDCVKNGGGSGCLSSCEHCGSSCTSCIKGGGGKACASRCCSSSSSSELLLSQRERNFMDKWEDIVTVHSASSLVQPLADNATASSRTLLQASNPWAMLQSIIQGICGDWSSIVNAFKSSYSEQLDYEQLTRGWSKFKEATKVFKGEGLTYDKAPEFFKDIQSMIQIPANYSKDFDQMIKFIQFFDKEYWSEHTTTFNIGQGGTASHFTMLANNNQDTSKIDVMFITLSESFALAPDVFVITESHSYLGGIWSTSKIKFDKHPAAISSEELEFVNQYFLLSAYQEIALAEGQPPPPNPNFGPSPTPMLTNTSHWASKGPLDTCTGPHESCCPAPGGDVNNCPASARTSDCDKKKSCCCG